MQMLFPLHNLHYFICFGLLGLLYQPTLAQDTLSLNGPWDFALDPTKSGEKLDWHFPPNSSGSRGWDEVEVPHCFSIDKRYEGYIGTVWYGKLFDYDGDVSSKHLRLHFDAVFYQCRVWLNGQYVGAHEGGYTPFAFDVTEYIKQGNNYLTVEVDNAWDHTTIPGARLGDQPKDLLYPWWEYGGITRDAYLIETRKVFVAKQKIEADPDLSSGRATVTVSTWIRNAGASPVSLNADFVLLAGEENITPDQENTRAVPVAPYSVVVTTQTLALAPEQVHLWHFDHPYLYQLHTTLSDRSGAGLHTVKERFGIRKVEAKNGKLFLNGEPIRVGGANRHSDHPVFASTDNHRVAEQDMTLIKEANMSFARLNHTPTSTAFMDWCDEKGFLVIAEAGNWQISPQQMADPVMRAKFVQQMTELIERDWNRPSVIGWSMGNEYRSWTPEGDAWTADMAAITKSLDSTRLITFVSLGSGGNEEHLATPHDSFRHCDLLCINMYGGVESLENGLENLHEKYPEKPIFVSEFGRRSDYDTEEARIAYFRDHMESVRKRDYVIGTSWWAFNDYRSRFPGTNQNGYREWGLVDPQRKPRALYHTVTEEYAPATVTLHDRGDGLEREAVVQARPDYPSYTLKGYMLVYQASDPSREPQVFPLDDLPPGESQRVSLKTAGSGTVQLRRPNGFVVVEQQF